MLKLVVRKVTARLSKVKSAYASVGRRIYIRVEVTVNV
jgi:hypothetical protein